MKKILLSSAAIVAFAGAAAAEVTFSGDAELGYNDDVYDGVYWDLGLTLGLSQELNNGWTVSGSLDIDVVDAASTAYDLGDIETSDWVLTLSNDMFAVSAGDVDTAYASFSGVGAVYDTDLFAPQDESDDYGDAAGLLVTADYGMFDAALSYNVADQAAGVGAGVGTDGELEELQAYVGAELGMFDFGLLYAEDIATNPSGLTGPDVDSFGDMIALSVSTTLAGAEITFSAADFDGSAFGPLTFDAGTNYGLAISYPVGPVTLGAFYVKYDNDLVDFLGADDDGYGISVDYADGPITLAAYYESIMGEDEYAVEGAYDFGMGLVVTAGYIDGDDTDDNDFAGYIVAEYDLGGGASFLASYAEATEYDESGDLDDIDTGVGGYELNYGATLALNFEF